MSVSKDEELTQIGERLVDICFRLDDARQEVEKLETEGRKLAEHYFSLKKQLDATNADGGDR